MTLCKIFELFFLTIGFHLLTIGKIELFYFLLKKIYIKYRRTVNEKITYNDSATSTRTLQFTYQVSHGIFVLAESSENDWAYK